MFSNESITAACLAALAGACWRVLAWLGARVDTYLKHRLEADAKLVEHIGTIAAAVVSLSDRIPEGAIAEIHAALFRKPEAGCTQTEVRLQGTGDSGQPALTGL